MNNEINFVDLNSLYKYLEDNAENYLDPHKIVDLLRKLRDQLVKQNNPDEAEKAQWEMDFFNFRLENGKVEPLFASPDNEGNIDEYPSLKSFDEMVYAYLISRLENTNNPLLKARYSHISWCSPKKHGKYAEIAVTSYLNLIKILEEKDKKEPKEHFGFYILEALKNAYYIAPTNSKRDEIKLELIRLVQGFNESSSSCPALKFNLIKFALEERKKFSKVDINGLEQVCWRISEVLIKRGELHLAIRMLELGERVDKKLEKKSFSWRKHSAQCYEKLMELTRQQEGKVAESLFLCEQAINNYKIIKDRKKIEELEQKYSELKDSLRSSKLLSTKFKVDASFLIELKKECKEVAEKIVQGNSNDIILRLMLNENLLPRYTDMLKRVKEYYEQTASHQTLGYVVYDQSGHPAQFFSTEEEKEYYAMLESYKIALEFDKLYLINEIFFSAIQQNKLSTEILLNFLKNHSFIGQTLQVKLHNDEILKYNWLGLIAPGIQDYFNQMHYYFLNPATNYPNLVLGIDSLTLKIEGILRDICRYLGVKTFYFNQDNRDRTIVREKDIYALLNEETIKDFFYEDDLLLFKFLLVEKAGCNLRHKVAHSLIIFQEYNVDIMHLLIIALLKLGNISISKHGDHILIERYFELNNNN